MKAKFKKPDATLPGLAYRACVTAWFDEERWTLRQLGMLELIGHQGRMDFGALCARIGLSKPVVTRAADILEARGLVMREVNPHDRRRIDIVVTPNGRDQLATFREMGR